MTEKEKIAIQIIYEEYKKDRSSSNLYMQTDELINKSHGALSLPDLHAVMLHGKSKYIGFLDPACLKVILYQEGVFYMENKILIIMKKWAYWIFGISSLIAAFFGILSYFKNNLCN